MEAVPIPWWNTRYVLALRDEFTPRDWGFKGQLEFNYANYIYFTWNKHSRALFHLGADDGKDSVARLKSIPFQLRVSKCVDKLNKYKDKINNNGAATFYLFF